MPRSQLKVEPWKLNVGSSVSRSSPRPIGAPRASAVDPLPHSQLRQISKRNPNPPAKPCQSVPTRAITPRRRKTKPRANPSHPLNPFASPSATFVPSRFHPPPTPDQPESKTNPPRHKNPRRATRRNTPTQKRQERTQRPSKRLSFPTPSPRSLAVSRTHGSQSPRRRDPWYNPNPIGGGDA